MLSLDWQEWLGGILLALICIYAYRDNLAAIAKKIGLGKGGEDSAKKTEKGIIGARTLGYVIGIIFGFVVVRIGFDFIDDFFGNTTWSNRPRFDRTTTIMALVSLLVMTYVVGYYVEAKMRETGLYDEEDIYDSSVWGSAMFSFCVAIPLVFALNSRIPSQIEPYYVLYWGVPLVGVAVLLFSDAGRWFLLTTFRPALAKRKAMQLQREHQEELRAKERELGELELRDLEAQNDELEEELARGRDIDMQIKRNERLKQALAKETEPKETVKPPNQKERVKRQMEDLKDNLRELYEEIEVVKNDTSMPETIKKDIVRDLEKKAQILRSQVMNRL